MQQNKKLQTTKQTKPRRKRPRRKRSIEKDKKRSVIIKYLSYEEIIDELKKVSFSSKMKFLFDESNNIQKELKSIRNSLFYFEAEKLSICIILSLYETHTNFFLPQTKQLIVSSIANYTPNLDNIKADDLMRPLILAQNRNGEYQKIILARLGYFFVEIIKNKFLNEQFKTKFNIDANKIYNSVVNLQKYLSKKRSFSDIINFLYAPDFSSELIDLLSINADDLYKKQKEILQNKNSGLEYSNIWAGLSLFIQYPFVRHNKKLYLATPHLLISALSTSIIFRFTEKNNQIRTEMGKVFENYLFFYFNESKKRNLLVYDGYEKEILYDKDKKKSSDLFLRYKKSIVAIELKFFSPSLELRKFNTEKAKINNQIKKIIEGLKQLYDNVTKYLNVKYYPFGKDIKFYKKNKFGILLTYDFTGINPLTIYNKFFEKYSIIDKKEKDYIKSNFIILSLHTFEKNYFTKSIFIDLVNRRDNKNLWGNYELLIS